MSDISITTPIFPANFPIGTSDKLFNFPKIASNVEPFPLPEFARIYHWQVASG
ncbi:MAG: hypothetical protein LH613_18560 [Chamaesiphon sp.]|nr:hypothetical protein [Chamaesiphon sp.]